MLDPEFRNVSPINWIEWAQNKGLDIPTQFNEIIVMSDKGKLFLKEGKDVIGLKIEGAQYVIRSATGGIHTTCKESYEVIKIVFNLLLEKGRYTLNDAALTIQEGANSPAKEMLKKLMLAAEDGSLKMYYHNNDSRYLYGEDFNTRVRDFYEVTTHTELNNWLDANEPLIKWRFPKPNSLEQLSTNETSNDHAIKGKPKTDRLYRLYEEIVNNIDNYKEIPKHKLIEHLKNLVGKKGSCIQSVDKKIYWLDRRGFPQETNFSSLGKWLSRHK